MKSDTRKRSVDNILKSVLILVVLVSPMVRLAVDVYIYFFVLVLMVGIAFILFLQNFYLGLKVLLPAFLLFTMIFYALIKNPNDSGALLFSTVSFVSFLLAYWFACQDKKLVTRLSFLALLIFYVFFIVSMLRNGYLPNDVNNYFVATSRNYVAATALFFQIMYSGSYYRINRKLPQVTPIITCLIALVAYGRSGVALSAALLVITFVFNLWKSKVVYKIIFFAILVVFFYWFSQHAVLAEQFIYSNTNFKLGFDTPRLLMLKEYLVSLDFFKVLAGQDLAEIPIMIQYDNNPHNSLIYGHSLHGFFYIALIGWFLFVAIWSCFFYKYTIVYAALLSVFMARIVLDKLALPGLFDYVFYYLNFILILDSTDRRTVKIRLLRH